ncbi:hypothetical protein N7530_005849, partial [Penicillium desertorum]
KKKARDSKGCGNGEVRRERKKRDQRRRQNITLAPRSEGGESILRLAVLSLSSLLRHSVVYNALYGVQSLIIALWYGNLKQDLSHDQPCHPRAVCIHILKASI